MDNILVIDIGGTSIKYSCYCDNSLQRVQSVLTPSSWDEMKQVFLKIYDEMKCTNLVGVAISSPGSVDIEKGVIKGVSAIPYIHHFEIVRELETLFQLPVTIENDANCAALAEVAFGVAKDVKDALFFIVGTGVGGAVVMNRQLIRGSHLFGGEFGCMYVGDNQTLSRAASPVHAARKFSDLYGEGQQINGEQLFQLSVEGDESARNIVDSLFWALAKGIYNALVMFDPEMVAIGGGLSKAPNLINELNWRINQLLQSNEITDLEYRLTTCQFYNDANLLGAVAHFMKQTKTK